MAALGTPVVPPVYWKSTTSSGETATLFGLAGAVAISSSKLMDVVAVGHVLQQAAGAHLLLDQPLEGPVQSRRHVGDDDMLDADVLADGRQPVHQPAEHDDRRRAAVRQYMLELGRRVGGVDVDHRAARLEDAEVGDHRLRDVGQHDRHPIALLDAEPLQGSREAVTGGVQFAVVHARADRQSQRQVLEHHTDRGVVGESLGSVGHHVLQQLVGHVNGLRNALFIVGEPGGRDLHKISSGRIGAWLGDADGWPGFQKESADA